MRPARARIFLRRFNFLDFYVRHLNPARGTLVFIVFSCSTTKINTSIY